MKVEIKHRFSGAILFAVEAGSLCVAVELAVAARANLDGANLDGASLVRASLDGASLDGAKINWQSHALISELLWRAANGHTDREQLAALIGRKMEWCWDRWQEFPHPQRAWAIQVLRDLARSDKDVPVFLRSERGDGVAIAPTEATAPQ
jgi:hypothetical protein